MLANPRCPLALAVLLTLVSAAAQAPATPPPTLKFEVVSIKPAAANAYMTGRWNLEPDGHYTCAVDGLLGLIQTAYNIDMARLANLPGWVKSARYAIDAEPPDGLPALKGAANFQRFRVMLLALLADRFQLVAHRETRRMPVYELVVAKGGSKFPPPAAPGQRTPVVGPVDPKRPNVVSPAHPGEVAAGASGISGLIGLIGHQMGRPVIDKTGITGDYDIRLSWQPQLQGPAAGSASGGANGPDIFTALQEQLGLRLQAATDPVAIVVIDHIAYPTPN